MPVFDMPLSELKSYSGRTPKPSDFDTYWEEALKELDNQDFNVSLTPSSFKAPNAECFDLYFTGVGGARIYAKYLRPLNSGKPHPAILQFHGYSHYSGHWNEKLAYVQAGFSVFAMDCRGQGGKSEDTGGVLGNTLRGHIIRGLDDKPENLLFKKIFLDTAALARIAMSMEDVDPTRVAAMGGSQGGGLTLACAGLVPELNRAAPMFPFLSDYRRVWEMDLAINAYDELREYFRKFDPMHKQEEEIYTRLGYIDVQNFAPRIKAKILMGTGLMDQICPPSTQFAAYNKIESEKNMLIYPDYGHEDIPDFPDEVYMFMCAMLD